MRVLHLITAALFGASVALAVPVIAGDDGPVAGVVHGDRADARVTNDGEVRVVPMTEGQWAYLGEFSLEPGARLSIDARGEEEYLYVLDGSGVLKVGEERFFVGPRMGVYIPPGVEAQWTNGPSQLIAVQFLVGASPGDGFDDWQVEDDQRRWHPPSPLPKPPPSELTVR